MRIRFALVFNVIVRVMSGDGSADVGPRSATLILILLPEHRHELALGLLIAET